MRNNNLIKAIEKTTKIGGIKISVSLPLLKKIIDKELLLKQQYQLFEKQAREEEYPNIANVFQAFQKGLNIIIRNHKRAIRKEDISEAEHSEKDLKSLVKSTRENIEKSKLDLSAQYIKEYKEAIKKIKNTLTEESYRIEDDVVIYSLQWGQGVKKSHVKVLKLVQKYLKKELKFEPINLDYTNPYVCEVCGHLIFGKPKRLCPVCDNPPEFFDSLENNIKKEPVEQEVS